ncbi:hypothetical protein HZA96_03625 [Candidatus Woesearchaeota archaeon]|nr:hypothetical protein [Candidatus Woesearchaeota archaeon]
MSKKNIEYLGAYDHEGRLRKVRERKRLLEEIKTYSKKHNDANLAVRVVHLFLMNKMGELYIVKRGDKDENPFLYDKTLGAHMIHGEAYDIGLKRECFEEFELETAIVEPEAYKWVIKKTNLYEKAAITKIALDPWFKSVRKMKKEEPWVKRHRVQTYVGMYEGALRYLDGEAINLKMITLDNLEKEIISQPEIYTPDLVDLVSRYRPHLLL